MLWVAAEQQTAVLLLGRVSTCGPSLPRRRAGPCARAARRLCYAEMAVGLPIAGGAFNYISVTFGELAAW